MHGFLSVGVLGSTHPKAPAMPTREKGRERFPALSVRIFHYSLNYCATMNASHCRASHRQTATMFPATAVAAEIASPDELKDSFTCFQIEARYSFIIPDNCSLLATADDLFHSA